MVIDVKDGIICLENNCFHPSSAFNWTLNMSTFFYNHTFDRTALSQEAVSSPSAGKMCRTDGPYCFSIMSLPKCHYAPGLTFGTLLWENTSYLEQLAVLANVALNNPKTVKYPTLTCWSVCYYPDLDSFCFFCFDLGKRKSPLLSFHDVAGTLAHVFS